MLTVHMLYSMYMYSTVTVRTVMGAPPPETLKSFNRQYGSTTLTWTGPWYNMGSAVARTVLMLVVTDGLVGYMLW